MADGVPFMSEDHRDLHEEARLPDMFQNVADLYITALHKQRQRSPKQSSKAMAATGNSVFTVRT